MRQFSFVCGSLLGFLACGKPVPQHAAPLQLKAEFNNYWNNGTAEISRYELTQARYGALHRGELVVIAVTEPFRADKQVKAETPQSMQAAVPVFKVQQMRRFATGIYDYALTTTSFLRLDDLQGAFPLKITGSAVDWCGHAWLQANLRSGKYGIESRSYFEMPGDETYEIAAGIAEDALWQMVRIDAGRLPTGKVQIIPSFVSARLRHRKVAPEEALAELQVFARLRQSEYTVTFAKGTENERQVSYTFETEFPRKILEYRESYRDVIGAKNSRGPLVTTARLKKAIRSAYWSQHDPVDRKLRQQLGVTGFD